MDNPRTKAVDTAVALLQQGTLSWSQYRIIRAGLDHFEPLQDRDHALESLWREFSDVPMNPETECMDEEFMHFPDGTSREDIWHWFDERHSKGIAYLMYGAIKEPAKCYTVVDSSYDVGRDTYAFWSHEDADKSIEADVRTVVADLKAQGYERVEVLRHPDSASVYVPDSDIYYEWEIHETDIQ